MKGSRPPLAEPRNRIQRWEWCCWPDCREERYFRSDAPPMCLNHIIKVTAYGSSTARDIARQDFMSGLTPRLTPGTIQTEPGPQPVVYYVRLGEYIKIGTTVNLAKRLNALQADHDPDALLATEPGDRQVEAQRHGQFYEDRVFHNRELFRPSERLLEHIAALKAAHAA